MKELKDYLPYYLGCEVMTNEGKGKLISVGFNDKVLDIKISLVDGDNECIEWFKLILYPLSVINKPYPLKFHKGTVIPLEYISTSVADSQQMMKRIQNNQSIDVFEFWKIERLLELRFDVFCLIPAGLAIDKTTLK